MDLTKRFMPAVHLLALLSIALASKSLPAQTAEEAAETVTTEKPVNFPREVQPLLASRCFSCHGPDADEGGLQLHESASALSELESGDRAIVPGKPDLSTLIERITEEDEFTRMPLEEDPLTPDQIDILRRWIEEGANFEKHWAFEPRQSPAPPTVTKKDWPRNPIDAFILARLEAADLTPAKPAEKAVLARRLYYDLTGLPPSPDELDEYLADDRPDAYQRLVDRLLESPQYGERWARHWLDVVRYAESNSYERDGTKPFVWKYRDYVIQSFNDDKPYDQFVREQLSGDELDEVTVETMTATGYYRLGIFQDEPADELQVKADETDDIVRTTSQAFLGLTIGCARCHDHKIDPIAQTDYYGLVAFFADVTPYAEGGDRPKNSLWDISSPEVAKQHEEFDNRAEELYEEKHQTEQAAIKKFPGELQRKTEGEDREKVLRENIKKYLSEAALAAYEELSERVSQIDRDRRNLPERDSVLSLARLDANPPPTHLFQRGNPRSPGEVVPPRFPSLFGDPLPEFPTVAPDARSAGRRRVLADWITSPDNRLSSRVFVNRVWQHHFGRGIVRSPNNFGQLGIQPTHPELLDWLAGWFVEGGWRLKPLHRLILTSSAYRMSSAADERALAADPTNNLFWRFDRRRLSAEEVRDSILAVSGKLNLQMFGPSIYPRLSDEVLATQSRPGAGWGDSTPLEQARRSIYVHIKRSLIMPMLTNFDFPDPDLSCEARFITTQPSQALNLLHSEFLHEQAGHLAERTRQEAGEDLRDQVGQTIRLALARQPTEADLEDGLDLIETLMSKHAKPQSEALRYYCLSVLNLNEFIYLD